VQLSEEMNSGFATREREADWELPLKVAVTWAVWFAVKLPTVAVNAAVVAPAATATDAGTPSPVLLLERDTAEPPAGAAALRVMVQAEVAP
jgi:hypothetical protein